MMEREEPRLTTDDLASSGTEPRREVEGTGDEARPYADEGSGYASGAAGEARNDVAGPEREGYEARERERASEEDASTTAAEPGETATPASAGETTPSAEPTIDGEASASLLARGDAADFRTQWESIQTGFVDEPRRAVEQADALVATLMQRLADTFSQERKSLESQWDRGDDVSTEDLRVALQRYRSFFDRLLSA